MELLNPKAYRGYFQQAENNKRRERSSDNALEVDWLIKVTKSFIFVVSDCLDYVSDNITLFSAETSQVVVQQLYSGIKTLGLERHGNDASDEENVVELLPVDS